jgi:hypothetical protein
MIITMLKGVIDAMPVLFLQMSETSSSAIDFRLTPLNSDFKMNLGTANYYGLDPFNEANLNVHTTQP